MVNVRRNHTTEFKTKVAVEAIRQQKTINELTTKYGVHATQINLRKTQALAVMPEAFSGKKEKARETQQQDIDELHRLGQLIAERDWLKKVFGQPLAARQLWIDSQDPLFSTKQQCHLLGINPSSLYYQPAGESEENLALTGRSLKAR
ncbi:MAG: hypothetical protein ACXWT2_07080 [Methylovulum sp.]